MEEAVTDQIVRTTKMHVDNNAVLAAANAPRAPPQEFIQATDSQRDGDIVDIQTNQFNYNRPAPSQDGTIVSKNSGGIKEQIPQDI